MLQVFAPFVKQYLARRLRRIDAFVARPEDTQLRVWRSLMASGRRTQFGAEQAFDNLHTPEKFSAAVPVRGYEAFYPYIDRVLHGEPNVLWPGRTTWFAKSSGTTNDRSKFIPITPENLEFCHFGGGRDMMALYFRSRPDSKLLSGKALTIGGSHQISQFNRSARHGDLSSVLLENLPLYYGMRRAPSKRVALMSNYEEKLELMAREVVSDNITSLVGVPTWTVILLRKILARTGQKDLRAVWPNLEGYFHGGVNFAPYRRQFHDFYPDAQMAYMETYNASEGFFALQDDLNDPGLLLLLDNGIYYEFIALDEVDKPHPVACPIGGVELNKTYAVILSTNSGLWRYALGDTVRFTSLNPHRLVITGRTRHFINAFGEELMIDNAEQALAEACRVTGAELSDYTVAPIYYREKEPGGHEWLIEFRQPPADLAPFAEVLDQTLKKINTDYEAKRYKNMAMTAPTIRVLPEGTFYRWMKQRGKLGGQNKVPRLSNDRIYIDEILGLAGGVGKI